MFGSLLQAGAGIIGSVMAGNNASRAARDAAAAQGRMLQAGIDEQRSAYQDILGLLSPYSRGGTAAFTSQLDLAGVNGPEAQATALAGLQQLPQFTESLRLGENAILQNASATGGLRGGNTQAALMQFRPQLLASTIAQQMAQLGGLSNMGLNAGSNLGQFRTGLASNVANLFSQQGAAQAGGILGQAAGRNQMIGGIAGALGQFAGSFGGAPAGAGAPTSIPGWPTFGSTPPPLPVFGGLGGF